MPSRKPAVADVRTHFSLPVMAPSRDVDEAVIAPMLIALPAPLHIRGKPAAIETLLNVYRHALAGFERETLEKAWLKVAASQDYWCWPMPETLVKAAKHFHDLAHPFDPRQTDAWVDKAQALTDAYVKRFMLTTQTAVRAREGGYEAALKEYVEAASWVQAQFIVGRHNVGYSACVLSGPKADGEEKAEFFEKAREQAKSGHIRVNIPPAKIEAWKQLGQGRAR
jgi:hypothetical protein